MTENSTNTVVQLQNRVTAVMPLLNENLTAAHRDWMDCVIPRGAYEYCLSRHATALNLLGADERLLEPDLTFKACSTLFIDLRAAMNDMPANKKQEEQAKVDALLALYVANGFTEMHPLFNIPSKPAAPRTANEVAMRFGANADRELKGDGYHGEVLDSRPHPLVTLTIDGISEEKAHVILTILNSKA